MIDARQNYGDHRWVGISQDGGEEWSRPRAGQFLLDVFVRAVVFLGDRIQQRRWFERFLAVAGSAVTRYAFMYS